jgi:CRP/FNR family transcriptional regulator
MAITAFGSVKQRVASQLLQLATTKNRSDAQLSAQVSQQELADAVGSVREVVARRCGISVQPESSPPRRTRW